MARRLRLSFKDARTLKRVTAATGFRLKQQPYKPNWDIERAIKDGFERVLYVYRCVDAIATNQARTKIELRRGSKDGQVIDGSREDLIRLLNLKPNDYETATQFRYRVSCQLLLSKQGVFVELVRSNGGGIASVHLLPAGRTAPVPGTPDADGKIRRFVDGYRVDYADGGFDILKPEQVLWIRKPHPTNPYFSSTPLEAAGIAADIDFYARLFNRNFLLNDGRPGGILAVKGELSTEDAAELKARFSGGPAAAGRTSVIEADEVEWVDSSVNPRDAQYTQAMAATKLDLLLAFGVPESVLGNASGRCVDDQTECLTKRGWVNGRELTTDDTILSMDPKDGVLKWGPVHEVYRNEHYAGPMHRLSHKHADYLVTPGHKWAVEPRAGQGVKGFVPQTVAELKKVEHLSAADRLIVMGGAERENWDATYSSAFVELVGWHITEGSIDSPTYIRICQNEGPHADRIRDCLKESGALWSEGHKTEAAHQRIFYVRGETAVAVNAVAPGKVMTYEFVNALTAAQRELLMRTMLDADGSYNTGGTPIFTQKSREMADAFVYVATLAGYRTTMRHETYGRSESSTSFADVDRWRVIVSKRKTQTFRRSENHTIEHYEGLVWCPRTDYGTMVARRSGRVFVTGQTYDNAGAEEAIFWRVTMIPHCEMIDEAFDQVTAGGITDNLFLAHDTSEIAPLRRDERERHAKALQEFQAGAINLDEYREETGRKALDVPGSRVHWLPTGKIGIGQPDDEAYVAKMMAAGQGDLGGGGLPQGASTDFGSQYQQPPALDPVGGGWQADAAATQLDRIANGAGNNTANGTMDPRGNGLALGVKGLPMPSDLSPAQLGAVLELIDTHQAA